jgi:hypothetical protein
MDSLLPTLLLQGPSTKELAVLFGLVLVVVAIVYIIFFVSNKIRVKKIYYFYSKGCRYCTEFNPEWEKLSGNMYIKIDINDPSNTNMVNEFNISQVPTIIKLENDKQFKYSGNRKAEDIKAWAQT